jgi:phosphatidylglycerophosphate synthase
VIDDVDKRDQSPLAPFERWMGRVGALLIPHRMSANQVTLIGGGFGLLAGLAFWLASFSAGWFVVGAVLVLAHWAADNVDGHVARTRDHCTEAGRFLDIFSDAITFAALGIGIGFANYSHFGIVAVATMLCLLQYVLTVLWIAFGRIWPFPTFGPAEASLTLIMIALLMLILPTDLFTVASMNFSLVDLAFALTIPSSLITLLTSGLALFRHLQRLPVATETPERR